MIGSMSDTDRWIVFAFEPIVWVADTKKQLFGKTRRRNGDNIFISITSNHLPLGDLFEVLLKNSFML